MARFVDRYWISSWDLPAGVRHEQQVLVHPVVNVVFEAHGASASGVVEQMSRRFAESERLWLGIAPEGTRQRVEKWKNGFWHIARAARVPILPVYFDYPSRTIGLGPVFEPTDDLAADTAALRAFYAPFRGKHRGTG